MNIHDLFTGHVHRNVHRQCMCTGSTAECAQGTRAMSKENNKAQAPDRVFTLKCEHLCEQLLWFYRETAMHSAPWQPPLWLHGYPKNTQRDLSMPSECIKTKSKALQVIYQQFARSSLQALVRGCSNSIDLTPCRLTVHVRSLLHHLCVCHQAGSCLFPAILSA